MLEDGTEFRGTLFGAVRPVAGEVVFNTGMVGYPESLTDPSYAGQILILTYPHIGNYGVPSQRLDELGLPEWFESERVQIAGLVIATLSDDVSHWSAESSFDAWLKKENIPGLSGVDTRALAKRIRDRGAMLGRLLPAGTDLPLRDPNLSNLAAEVCVREPVAYGKDGPRIVLVDTGVKASIIRGLVRAGARVLRVPWDHDFFGETFDGLFLSNGPGDPKSVDRTVAHVRRALEQRVPTFGVCLGNQILALAAGADTYKLKFGHRSQNQPCHEVGTRRCMVTSQNHGYAVDGATLPPGWREWFVNANDGTNEGIRHEWKPARGVQFHPEASPGPTDTAFLFQRFLEMLR
ncbi:MAG TPA: glutamine-hydrolyzing carbamoyl-phosphate synthase small subunit [Candidatus Cryosericum sp.]|nr:glutamine-hydrolyzing carbamoyl-phosphate synthase small subunit [Candidatus Cryosericum sp.]